MQTRSEPSAYEDDHQDNHCTKRLPRMYIIVYSSCVYRKQLRESNSNRYTVNTLFEFPYDTKNIYTYNSSTHAKIRIYAST